MTNRIPITFTHKGKQYTGFLVPVMGAGSTSVYHLSINNYYHGRLRYSEFTKGWVFDGEFAELADYFGNYLLAWYDGG